MADSQIGSSLRAGALRHPITIDAPSTAPSSFGGSVSPTRWETVRTTRAAIEAAGKRKDRETAQAGQLISEVTHFVTVRWTPAAIRAGYRVVFGARYFTIELVENGLEQNRVLVLWCREVDGTQ